MILQFVIVLAALGVAVLILSLLLNAAGGLLMLFVGVLGAITEGFFKLPRLFGVSAERVASVRAWINNGKPSFRS